MDLKDVYPGKNARELKGIEENLLRFIGVLYRIHSSPQGKALLESKARATFKPPAQAEVGPPT